MVGKNLRKIIIILFSFNRVLHLISISNLFIYKFERRRREKKSMPICINPLEIVQLNRAEAEYCTKSSSYSEYASRIKKKKINLAKLLSVIFVACATLFSLFHFAFPFLLSSICIDEVVVVFVIDVEMIYLSILCVCLCPCLF